MRAQSRMMSLSGWTKIPLQLLWRWLLTSEGHRNVWSVLHWTDKVSRREREPREWKIWMKMPSDASSTTATTNTLRQRCAPFLRTLIHLKQTLNQIRIDSSVSPHLNIHPHNQWSFELHLNPVRLISINLLKHEREGGATVYCCSHTIQVSLNANLKHLFRIIDT